MKTVSLSLLGVVLATPVLAGDWAVTADYMESCSCKVICPCLFEGEPDQRECLGQGALRVTEGHYGDVDLAGVTVFCTFSMGNWEMYTVSDKNTAEQAAAIRKIIEATLTTPGAKIVRFEQGPVSWSEHDGKVTCGAENSEVEIEPIMGSDGKPIRIDNVPDYPGYEQYRSVKNKHHSSQAEFSFSDTNGLTAKMVLSPEK